MKFRTILPALLILVGISAAGCDSATASEPRTFSAAGVWSGTSGTMTMRLTLAQSGPQVTGNGTVSAGGNAIALTASGTSVSNNVSLTLTASGYEDLNFTGTLTSAATLAGQLNGSGFANQAITLNRN